MNTIVDKSSARASAAKIRAGFAIGRIDVRNERSYRYTHAATERQFTVRRLQYAGERARFFLCEMLPNGRMLDVNEQGDITRSWDEPRIMDTESRVAPNELLATLRAMGIAVEAMVFWGAGHSVDSIYYESSETCAESIARALNENARYVSYKGDRDA
jgi:acetyl esterase/lipase